jgi:dipeptide/tripeptide permease
VAREFFILSLFLAAIAFLLGKGYYKAFRSGVLTIIGHTAKSRTYRRDEEPTLYWICMAIGAFAFLVTASFAAVMAFLVCVNLFGTSK